MVVTMILMTDCARRNLISNRPEGIRVDYDDDGTSFEGGNDLAACCAAIISSRALLGLVKRHDADLLHAFWY